MMSRAFAVLLTFALASTVGGGWIYDGTGRVSSDADAVGRAQPLRSDAPWTDHRRQEWERALPASHEPLSGFDDPCFTVRVKAQQGLYGYPADIFPGMVPESVIGDDGADSPSLFRGLREVVCRERPHLQFLRSSFDWAAQGSLASTHRVDVLCSVIAPPPVAMDSAYGRLREMTCNPPPRSGVQSLSLSFTCEGRLIGLQEGDAENGLLSDLVRLMLFMEQRHHASTTTLRDQCGELDGLTGHFRSNAVIAGL